MKEYLHRIEEAAKRDHRKVGKAQGLFDHHEWAPGCAFFYPNGTFIYNKLVDMIREQYRVRGF
jgi:threonyl-tRNA synthetase